MSEPEQSEALAEFLRRSAPVVAQHRGLTPPARLIAQKLASELKLSAKEFERGIVILQRGDATRPKLDAVARAGFRESMAILLGQVNSGILSKPLERQLSQIGAREFKLSSEAVEEEIRAIAKERKLRRISLEDSLRHLEEMIGQKVGEGVKIDAGSMSRLYEAAERWGLSPDDVDGLVRERLEANALGRRRAAAWSQGAKVAAIVFGAVLVGGLLYNFVLRRPEPNAVAETVTPSNDGAPSVAISNRATKRPPPWWTAELAVAVSEARKSETDFEPLYEAIIAPDSGPRSAGYERLIERMMREPFDARNVRLLEPIVAGCYAFDPEEAASGRLRERLAEPLRETLARVPQSPRKYDTAVQSLGMLLRIAESPVLPPPRRQAIRNLIGSLLHIDFPDGETAEERERRGVGSLAAQLLENLAREISVRPDILAAHHAVLAAAARDRVEPERLAKLEAALAAEGVRHAASSWRSWERLLNRAAQVRDPPAILRLVDAYAATREESLKQMLGPLLLARAGIVPGSLPESEWAAAIQRTLGGRSSSDVAKPWSQWKERTAALLKSSATVGSDDQAQLRAAVEAAYHANLALLLMRPSPETERFERLYAQGPPAASAAAAVEAEAAPAAKSGRLLIAQRETFDRYVEELATPEELEEARRISYFRGVGQMAERLDDVWPQQAAALATYLWCKKSDDEHRQVLESLRRMRTWKRLRLAAADTTASSALTGDQLASLMISLTGREIEPGGERDFAALSRLLKRSVLADTELESGRGQTTDETNGLDRLVADLAPIYRERSQTLGATTSPKAAAFSPSTALTAAVRSGGETASRAIDVADAMGVSDAQRTVILQRALLRIVADGIIAQRPDRRAACERLLEETAKRDRDSTYVLPQLLEGELALLRLLQLGAP